MASYGDYKDLGVTLDDHVAVVEIQRPPHNFFDFELIASLASAFEDLGRDDACRAIMLCAQGKAFCAGANFGGGGEQELDRNSGHLYQEAVRLFRTPKPVVGAIQGAAIGGGLGLALMPDFRVASPEARFSANFTRLGFHPGFGLTVTLPEVIGKSQAALMFYTSRRIKGEEAHEMGLVDVLAPQDKLRETAHALAAEIAENSPLGVVETRATLRGDLADRVKRATDHELAIQDRLRQTEDFQEGIRAVSERRVPDFKGR
ncbi:enoyl-CoA hydratase/isomerase family protein [Minwuia thermotolerans]|uniref:Enoyl-CoA hydratase n=1 Tax=Minwuia thermotolerans TaxID=2056226 RepID=A0A2M9G386_9PROT|nr:enoyl-CoA hydratase/isomerase family protein [Minwuia thermotolerans]PJK30173.1 enoyl-CoA hydratase [Minwuia thermotolerans]